jgi:hypothetical protein
MRFFLFCVGGIWLNLTISAQALQVDAHLSGGMSWSQGTSGPHIRQMPFLTSYAQVGLGYWITPRFGIGAGMVRYPIGITHEFKMDTFDISHWGSKSTSRTYPYMLQFDLRYHIPLGATWLSGSQLSLGMITARSDLSFSWISGSNYEYANGQVLSQWSQTQVAVDRYWALMGRWDYPVWETGRHQVSLSLHVLKGLTPASQTTRGYFIEDPDAVVRGDWTTYGDYVGLGITYQLTCWQRTLNPQCDCRY